MNIIVISDIHTRWNEVTTSDCDILISCGDYSFRGEEQVVRDFHTWLSKQPAKHVISVQGNHELGVEKNFPLAKQIVADIDPKIRFIDEGLVEIEGIKIWCSAITPFYHDWAWNRYRGDEIKRHWDSIPDDIDILVTHGPPHGILDKTLNTGEHVGCADLKDRIDKLPNLRYHCFGHIHEGYGQLIVGQVAYINAAICNEKYKAVNKPICFNI